MAANSSLRERTLAACIADGLDAYLPSRAMCTDNAAMIAAAGWWRLQSDGPTSLAAGADPEPSASSCPGRDGGRPRREELVAETEATLAVGACECQPEPLLSLALARPEC